MTITRVPEAASASRMQILGELPNTKGGGPRTVAELRALVRDCQIAVSHEGSVLASVQQTEAGLIIEFDGIPLDLLPVDLPVLHHAALLEVGEAGLMAWLDPVEGPAGIYLIQGDAPIELIRALSTIEEILPTPYGMAIKGTVKKLAEQEQGSCYRVVLPGLHSIDGRQAKDILTGKLRPAALNISLLPDADIQVMKATEQGIEQHLFGPSGILAPVRMIQTTKPLISVPLGKSWADFHLMSNGYEAPFLKGKKVRGCMLENVWPTPGYGSVILCEALSAKQEGSRNVLRRLVQVMPNGNRKILCEGFFQPLRAKDVACRIGTGDLHIVACVWEAGKVRTFSTCDQSSSIDLHPDESLMDLMLDAQGQVHAYACRGPLEDRLVVRGFQMEAAPVIWNIEVLAGAVYYNAIRQNQVLFGAVEGGLDGG